MKVRPAEAAHTPPEQQLPANGRSRLRVVYVNHIAQLSGGEIALARLLEAVADDVDAVVLLGEDGPLSTRLERAGARVEILPMHERMRDVRRSEIRPAGFPMVQGLRFVRYTFRLRRRLRELRPDLIHTNSLKAAIYGGLAGRMSGIPVLWHIRDRIAPDYLPQSAVTLVRFLARRVPTAVIANSSATLATLPPLRHTGVVHSPVMPDVIPRPRDGALLDGPPVIGMVGRLAPWKGQHVFLRAFAAAFPDGQIRARIIGSAMFGDQPYEEEIRSLAEELGISDRVEWQGFQSDVDHELARLTALVHCSVTAEPFGQVVVEGMAAGLPVIAAAAGGPLEVITPGVDGLLTPPGDVESLAAAMRRLMDDGDLRASLGRQARSAVQRFGPSAARARLLDVYRIVTEPELSTQHAHVPYR